MVRLGFGFLGARGCLQRILRLIARARASSPIQVLGLIDFFMPRSNSGPAVQLRRWSGTQRTSSASYRHGRSRSASTGRRGDPCPAWIVCSRVHGRARARTFNYFLKNQSSFRLGHDGRDGQNAGQRRPSKGYPSRVHSQQCKVRFQRSTDAISTPSCAPSAPASRVHPSSMWWATSEPSSGSWRRRWPDASASRDGVDLTVDRLSARAYNGPRRVGAWELRRVDVRP